MLTTNVTTLDLPSGLPSGLSCVACAAKVCLPLGRAGADSPEVHAPPVPLTLRFGQFRAFGFGAFVDVDDHVGRGGRRAREDRRLIVRGARGRGKRHFRRARIDDEGDRVARSRGVPQRARLGRHGRVVAAFQRTRQADRAPFAARHVSLGGLQRAAFRFAAFEDRDSDRFRFAGGAAEGGFRVVGGGFDRVERHFRRVRVDDEGPRFAFPWPVAERAFLFGEGRVGAARESRSGARRPPFARRDSGFGAGHRGARNGRAFVDA